MQNNILKRVKKNRYFCLLEVDNLKKTLKQNKDIDKLSIGVPHL